MTARKIGHCPRCLKPWVKGHHHDMPIRKSLAERFWTKVEPEPISGCFLWMGALNEHGYGVINRGRAGLGMEKAHRVAWILDQGIIPYGLNVLHKCDVPACVNPQHLYLGTMQDNVNDMMARGRQVSRRGTEHSFAKLNDNQVREIRRLYADGGHSYASLGRCFGMSKPQIGNIITRRKWAWLP